MLLGELVGCIELLQERIRSHRDALRENETRTRMALIDPLLRALGWDVFDPGMVKPEYKVEGGWADYALLCSDGRPAATVEAKKLGEALSSHRMQMLNYANASGIEYAGLTDGNHWELYSVFEPGPLHARKKLEISITSTPVNESALKLLLVWRPNLASGRPVPAAAPILDDTWPTIDPDPIPPSPTPDPSLAPLPVPSGWVALSEYNPPAGSPCPTSIRFWDGGEQPLEYWHEMLTGVVKKLYSEGLLAVKDVPIGRGRSSKVYSVHTEPVHPTGKEFGQAKWVEGTPFVVNVNLNAGQVRANTRKLLERFGRNPAEVHLQVTQ